MTGSFLPAFRRACTIAPGPDATYVLRCPLLVKLSLRALVKQKDTHRISASSLTPPRDIRWNGLSRALAIDCPREVFPVPGGPTNLYATKFNSYPLSFIREDTHRSIGPLTPLLFGGDGEELEIDTALSTVPGLEAGTSAPWFASSPSVCGKAEVAAAASAMARKRTIARYSMSRRLI
jgi:hypothetical protein